MFGATHYDQDPLRMSRTRIPENPQTTGRNCEDYLAFMDRPMFKPGVKSWLTSGPHPRTDPPIDGWYHKGRKLLLAKLLNINSSVRRKATGLPNAPAPLFPPLARSGYHTLPFMP